MRAALSVGTELIGGIANCQKNVASCVLPRRGFAVGVEEEWRAENRDFSQKKERKLAKVLKRSSLKPRYYRVYSVSLVTVGTRMTKAGSREPGPDGLFTQVTRMTNNEQTPNSELSEATHLPLTRLGAYLAIGLGSGALATTSEAAVIPIDVSSISAVNGGVASGSNLSVPDWPTANAGTLFLLNGSFGGVGLSGQNLLYIAAGNYNASPIKFGVGSVVDATGGGSANNWFTGLVQTSFALNYYGNTFLAPDFGPGSYLGFKDALGRYGYIEVTWNSTTREFQVLSAAYESQVGVGITISAAAVPEPGTTGLAGTAMLAIGSAAMLERRRRQRAAAATAAQATA